MTSGIVNWRRLSLEAALVWCLHLPAGSIAAAQVSATLSGIVVDASGGVVAGAHVRIRAADGTSLTASTGGDGTFRFDALPPGRLIVDVERALFEPARVEVELSSLAPAPLRIVLRIAGLSEAVTVAVPRVDERPLGLVATTIDRDGFKNAAGFSIGEVLVFSPGVTVVQGNGPRDVSVSVRGSNARQTFGIRNIQVFEDGFPVTQPDGLARTDLTDPHAYGAIDVFRGPSSALYGNYAVEGAVNFRSRVDATGVEGGLDLGSFGYRNLHGMFGYRNNAIQVTAFGSVVGGDGFTAHTSYLTSTANVLMTYRATPSDVLTFKFINNENDPDLSIRLSLNQYHANPYQEECATLSGTGCASVNVFANGFNGPRVALSPEQAGLGRDDRRTIAGLRWERTFGDATTWRTQAVFDNRDIDQPTGATSAVGTFPSVNVVSDVTRNGRLGRLEAVHFAGMFANYQDINSSTFNLMPGGDATLGALAATTFGSHFNAGLRAREEVRFGSRWTGVAGLGVERTELTGLNTGYGYPLLAPPTTTATEVKRTFTNVAPEATVYFRPNAMWQVQARLGAGYGTPQLGNLFVTPAGVNGTNLDLKSQSNIGIDLGVEVRVTDRITASAAWFRERYRNELVSQSPGPNLLNYTFNAPRSVHQGIELSADWRPLGSRLAGLRLQAAYTWNDQYYAEYVERLSAGSQTAAFDRAGNRIPGVTPHYLNARVGYDHAAGALAGLGVYAELNVRDEAFVDNANLLEAPGYSLVNLNLHYDPTAGWLRRLRLFVDIRNLTDEVFVASASNLANTLNPLTGRENPASVLANTGGIYAGSPRSVVVGARVKF